MLLNCPLRSSWGQMSDVVCLKRVKKDQEMWKKKVGRGGRELLGEQVKGGERWDWHFVEWPRLSWNKMFLLSLLFFFLLNEKEKGKEKKRTWKKWKWPRFEFSLSDYVESNKRLFLGRRRLFSQRQRLHDVTLTWHELVLCFCATQKPVAGKRWPQGALYCRCINTLCVYMRRQQLASWRQ